MASGYSSQDRGAVEPTAPHRTAGLLVGVIVVASLYFGREVFIPIALAILLSFVLAIPARLLQGLGLGRTLPVVAVVVLAFGVILSVGAVVTSQLTQLAGDLPRYQTTIRDKIASLRGAASGHGPLERVVGMVQDLSSDFTGGTSPPASGGGRSGQSGAAPSGGEGGGPAGARADQAPMPVRIVPSERSPLDTVQAFVTPLIHPLATTGLVAIFVVFILMQRGDLRNRLIRLAGSADLQRTTAAMNDGASRLSRFFLFQVLLNSTFGIAIGLGLWAFGVPSPVLWGILAGISRFVPYVGAAIAAGGPLLLSAAVDPGWTMLLETAALFVLAELLVGQVVEPLVYGHSTGLSPVAVIVSVTFWTWLWGGVGLLLATPLTVCLVVLGRHVEQLEFLDVMFGDRPPLTAAESFYQRMLAGDAAEGLEQAETFLKEHALATYYDEVALKGVALAQADLARGALDPARLETVEKTVSDLIEELAEHDDVVPDPDVRKVDPKRADGDADLDESLARADEASTGLPAVRPELLAEGWNDGTPVLCVAGRNGLDRTGALMLAQLLGKHGIGARADGPEGLAGAGAAPGGGAVRMVCLSFLDASTPVQVRYAVRRVRRRLPGARILVGSWTLDHDGAKSLCEASRSDLCASRLSDALGLCLEEARNRPDAASEPGRLASAA